MKTEIQEVEPPIFKPIEVLITFEAQWEVDAFATLLGTAKSDAFKDVFDKLYPYQSID